MGCEGQWPAPGAQNAKPLSIFADGAVQQSYTKKGHPPTRPEDALSTFNFEFA